MNLPGMHDIQSTFIKGVHQTSQNQSNRQSAISQSFLRGLQRFPPLISPPQTPSCDIFHSLFSERFDDAAHPQGRLVVAVKRSRPPLAGQTTSSLRCGEAAIDGVECGSRRSLGLTRIHDGLAPIHAGPRCENVNSQRGVWHNGRMLCCAAAMCCTTVTNRVK